MRVRQSIGYFRAFIAITSGSRHIARWQYAQKTALSPVKVCIPGTDLDNLAPRARVLPPRDGYRERVHWLVLHARSEIVEIWFLRHISQDLPSYCGGLTPTGKERLFGLLVGNLWLLGGGQSANGLILLECGVA